MEGKILLVLLFVFLLDSNDGQMVYLGRCPALKPVSDFDMAKVISLPVHFTFAANFNSCGCSTQERGSNTSRTDDTSS
jgi:hypothetical protein